GGRGGPAGAGQVVFDGDSLTLGTGATGGQTYPAQTSALLGGWPGVNLGVSGQRTDQMLADVVTDVDGRYSAGLANYLAAWCGTNDLYQSVAADLALKYLAQYCSGRLARGYRVAVATLTPCSSIGTPAGFEAARQALNTNLRANWRAFADGLIDLGANATIGPAGAELNPTYYQGDKIHMTNAGYGIVAGLAKTALLGLRGGRLLGRDQFNRADNAASLGNADAGGAWQAVTGTWGIAANQAYCAVVGGQNLAVLEAGRADVALSLALATPSDYCGIAFRVQDANNFLVFNRFLDGAVYRYSLQERVAGVWAQLGTTNATISAAGDVLSVVANGSSVKCYVNGLLLYDQVTTRFQGSTRHGLYTFETTTRLENFSCRVVG
ncbi:MAG TPA: SGNH/GDSL hydrolase family protein, partial [Longimicrobiales bacterium]